MTKQEITKKLQKAGILTAEGQINYLNYSIEKPLKAIKSTDRVKIKTAVYTLCEMIKVGNNTAMFVLFDAFNDNKLNFKYLEIIAENLQAIENNEYIDFIFDFLEKTKSNATSRIFIRSLIEFFIKYNNNDKVIERLDRLAKSKKFSYRMKKHFKHAKEAVLRISSFSFYEDHYY